mmetsp:Transcript_841/g.2395  ORF Transcript_841/g.2395 Transcript_841/m.2395 type:complete len:92 (+) Transcript_841:41-316(+)
MFTKSSKAPSALPAGLVRVHFRVFLWPSSSLLQTPLSPMSLSLDFLVALFAFVGLPARLHIHTHTLSLSSFVGEFNVTSAVRIQVCMRAGM